MGEDEMVAEVRAVREAHASQFEFDLQAIYNDLKDQEQKSVRKIVSLPARPAVVISEEE
jgi:hypothetical protein